MRQLRRVVFGVMLGAAAAASGGTAAAGGGAPPSVLSVIEGRDSGADRPVLVLIGKSLTKFTSYALTDPLGKRAEETPQVLLRSKSMVVLGLASALPAGAYNLAGNFGRQDKLSFRVKAGPSDHDHAGTYMRLAGGDTMTGRLSVSSDDGVVFGGTVNSGTLAATGAGTRLVWHPTKAAFRAGYVEGAQWDDANIGNYSAAMGYDTIASGYGSTAMGYDTIASGYGSTAMGYVTTASGYMSTAMGHGTTASGDFSTAVGLSTIASSYASTAMGGSTTASANYSTAMGQGTHASAFASTALGYGTAASGSESTAMGSGTIASGYYSTAMGHYTTSQAAMSVVLGQYNTVAGNSSSWVSGDPVLVVGNGTGTSTYQRSNALTLLKNGDLTIAGTLTQNSDARLKTDIEPLGDVLARLDLVRGVSYRFKDEASGPAGRQIGLLAQEVREAFPDLVHEDPDGKLSVAYGNFTAVLLAAVKEQQREIEERDRELAALRAELTQTRDTLGRRLERLEALLGKR